VRKTLNHQDRLAREIAWHEGVPREHVLNRWPFRTADRNRENFEIAKTELFRMAWIKRPGFEPQRVLLAPAGHFNDLRYVNRLWPFASVHAVDIADGAFHEHPEISSKVADISEELPYPAGSFDVVISTRFFHHVIDEGFDAYLRQLRRVLRPGGLFIGMEHSWLDPAFWITRPLRRMIGNITSQVAHERPIFPWKLKAAMQRCGFISVFTFACSYGHNRMPIPVTKVVNLLLRPISPIHYFAWQVGFLAS
jgi:SAM-dependent methyltransferase